jgi:DNA-binding transcriptional LysR family regulator
MDQLAAMRAFVRIVESGSFTRTARSLNTPKPTVTKHIQTLEAHLRTRLLNRTTRRITVTPDGAAYYERAVRLLSELEELDGSMASSQARPKGKLRVDVSTTLAQLVVIPALPDFFERYPEIEIELGVSDRLADLVADNVDCALRAGTLTDPALVARRIAEMRFITCAAPSYLARFGEPLHPADIETGHRVVAYNKSSTGRFTLHFSRDGEEVEVRGRNLLAVDEGNAYVAAAAAGLGIIQVPEFSAQHQLESGELVEILSGWQSRTMQLYVVYGPQRHLSNKLRVFVDWTASLFARDRLSRQETAGTRALAAASAGLGTPPDLS